MNLVTTIVHIAIVLGMPSVMVGLRNRTRSLWAVRRGPGLVQSAWDLLRLLRKGTVVSTVARPLFRMGAWVVLASTLLAAMIAPIPGGTSPVQFEHGLGLGRLFVMLSAMDVGSAFEGMGVAREASFSAFVDPALFLLIGAAGDASFAGMIGHLHATPSFPLLAAPAVAALFILLQAEASRVPVDDPATHLEPTMIHAVMVLDHSGPDLAAMQYAAALEMTIYAGLTSSPC